MNKREVLKTVVILQAICMIALTGVVIVKMWPLSNPRQDEPTNQLPHTDIEVEGKTESQIIASVGGESISKDQLTKELYEQYGDRVLRLIMVRKAIDLEAQNTNISVTQEEVAHELASLVDGYDSEQQFFAVMSEQLGMTREHVLDELKYRLLLEKITVRSVAISDAEVDAYMEKHPEQFAPQLRMHLQWIVLETAAEANQVLQLIAEGSDFARLAQTYSIDSFTADSGGDLGYIQADDPFYNEEMLHIASELNVAEIAGPIEVEEGYAIIQLMGRNMTSGLTGYKQIAAVRKQLALERAKPMAQVEDELLEKYNALIKK